MHHELTKKAASQIDCRDKTLLIQMFRRRKKKKKSVVGEQLLKLMKGHSISRIIADTERKDTLLHRDVSRSVLRRIC